MVSQVFNLNLYIGSFFDRLFDLIWIGYENNEKIIKRIFKVGHKFNFLLFC